MHLRSLDVIMPSPLDGGIKYDARLTSICLSVAYIMLSREQRGLGKLKLAQR